MNTHARIQHNVQQRRAELHTYKKENVGDIWDKIEEILKEFLYKT